MLRSRYRQLRALLAVALAAAVVIIAVDDDRDVMLAPQVQGSAPSATGHDESDTAAAIGEANDGSTQTDGYEESGVSPLQRHAP